jgi:hypothetical protein
VLLEKQVFAKYHWFQNHGYVPSLDFILLKGWGNEGDEIT